MPFLSTIWFLLLLVFLNQPTAWAEPLRNAAERPIASESAAPLHSYRMAPKAMKALKELTPKQWLSIRTFATSTVKKAAANVQHRIDDAAEAVDDVANVVTPNVAPKAAKGGVQFGTQGDAFLVNASKATQPAGMLDVAVHGTPMSVDIGANTVNHRVLASLIERNPQFSGQPIRLLSCETGALPNGFAQNLANKLGVPVHAPNDLIWAWPNGTLSIGPSEFINSGSFVPFLPGGGVR